MPARHSSMSHELCIKEEDEKSFDVKIYFILWPASKFVERFIKLSRAFMDENFLIFSNLRYGKGRSSDLSDVFFSPVFRPGKYLAKTEKCQVPKSTRVFPCPRLRFGLTNLSRAGFALHSSGQ